MKLSDFSLKPLLTSIQSAIASILPSGFTTLATIGANGAPPSGYTLASEYSFADPVAGSVPSLQLFTPVSFSTTDQATSHFPSSSRPIIAETSSYFYTLNYLPLSGAQAQYINRYTKDWTYVDRVALSSSLQYSNMWVYGDNLFILAHSVSSNSWSAHQNYVLKFTTSTATYSTFWTQTGTGTAGRRAAIFKLGKYVYMCGRDGSGVSDLHAYRLDLDTGAGTVLNNVLPTTLDYCGPAATAAALTGFHSATNTINSTSTSTSSGISSVFIRSYETATMGFCVFQNTSPQSAVAGFSYQVNPVHIVGIGSDGAFFVRKLRLDGTGDIPLPPADLSNVGIVPNFATTTYDHATGKLLIPFQPVNTDNSKQWRWVSVYSMSSTGVLTLDGPLLLNYNAIQSMAPVIQCQPTSIPGTLLVGTTGHVLSLLRFSSATQYLPSGVRYVRKL